MTDHWIALLLAAAAPAVGAYWYAVFRRELPLKSRLKASAALRRQVADFAREMLQTHPLPATPRSFADAVQYGADRFLARFGGADLLVWVRRTAIGAFPASEGELVCRTGVLEAVRSEDLALPEDLWRLAFSAPARASWDAARMPPPLDRLFRGRGAARLLPWGREGKLWGVLAVLEDPAGRAAPPTGDEASSVLAAYLGALADRAVQFWELDRAREQLEGGLSATMRRLDETNLQLIQRAKEMRTIQEITDEISRRPGRMDALGAVAAMVAKSLEADLCAFLLLDEESGELVAQPGAYGLADDEVALQRIPLSNEAAGSVRVFRTGEPFVTGDVRSEPGASAGAGLWRCRSLLVVPVASGDRRIGVLRVGSSRPDFFTADHLRFAVIVAEEAAVLIEGAALSKKLARMSLEQAELHRMKDDFVSTVSHEFKTPLTSIRGFLRLLLDGDAGPVPEDQRRFLALALGAAERLSALVADVLDVSRLDARAQMSAGPVRLEEVLRAAVEGQALEAKAKGVELFCAASGLPAVRGDAEWLRRVLDNLISNAVKFTPAGGRVAVKAFPDQGAGPLDRAARISVSDTGIGIPAADQERIFEKFYRAANRTQAQAPGTGLGLAICRSVVERHGGRIWFESEEGRGTTFHVSLPAMDPAGAETAEQTPGDVPRGKV